MEGSKGLVLQDQEEEEEAEVHCWEFCSILDGWLQNPSINNFRNFFSSRKSSSSADEESLIKFKSGSK